MITRQWPGLIETFFSFEARHTFGISCKFITLNLLFSFFIISCPNQSIVPMDLDVKVKAVMILAAIIIVSSCNHADTPI